VVAVDIEDLTIRLGEFHLQQVHLHVAAGEYFVLLGPTGAGKTVLIECVAGLHRPSSGRILLDAEDVTSKPLEARGIGYVPQDYALFPNMTVMENIAFGLRVRKAPSWQVAQRVEELAELLHIQPLLGRHPLTLSGGEKQRVALARALAVRPRLLLLDEPLAAVDESTRDRLCAELKEIQRQTGVTVIHVSHNFEETLALADAVGILHNGRLICAGEPDDVFHHPPTRFVAEFTRAENIFPVDEIRPATGKGTVEVIADGYRLRLRSSNHPTGGKASFVVIRPETVTLQPPGQTAQADSANLLAARLKGVINKGSMLRLEAETEEGSRWVVLLPRSMANGLLPCGSEIVHLCVMPEDVHLIPSDQD